MPINSIEDLKEYFHHSRNCEDDHIFVSTAIRREWMLNSERTVVKGKVYDIKWTNMGGGVWKAQLCPLH